MWWWMHCKQQWAELLKLDVSRREKPKTEAVLLFSRWKRTTRKLPAWRGSMYSLQVLRYSSLLCVRVRICVYCVYSGLRRYGTGEDKSQRRSDTWSRTQKQLRVTHRMRVDSKPESPLMWFQYSEHSYRRMSTKIQRAEEEGRGDQPWVPVEPNTCDIGSIVELI